MAARAVISDFGGVLTTPLAGGLEAVSARSGVSAAQFGAALAALTASRSASPLAELETGALDETAFTRVLEAELGDRLGRPVTLEAFGEMFFSGLERNEPMLAHLRGCHARGVRLAICTNNVREWSSLWRSMLPELAMFEVVVDSAELGVRKPDPRIYEAVLTGLGIDADDAVFVDDLEVNCDAAAGLGMHAVLYRDAATAIAEIDAALA